MPPPHPRDLGEGSVCSWTQLEGLDPEVSGPRGCPWPGPPGPVAPKPLGSAVSDALPDPVGCANQHDRLK